MIAWLKAHRNRISTIGLFTILSGWAFAGIASNVGAYVEQKYFPIAGDQKIESVNYNPLGCLCWTWHFTKLRDVDADNVDVYLSYADKDANGNPTITKVVMAVFNGSNLVPFKLDANNPIGDTVREWCTFLPGGVRGHTPYHIQMSMRYPGFMGLWPVYVELPDITYDKAIPPASIGDPEYVDPATGKNPYAGTTAKE